MDLDDHYTPITDRDRSVFWHIVEAILWALVVVTFFLATLTRPARADESRADELRVKVFPAIQIWSQSALVRVTLWVQPHPQNHCLRLQYRFTYPGGGGSSSWEVDETSPRQHIRTIKYATPGKVWITAELHRIIEEKDTYIRREETARLRWGDEDEDSP